MQTMSQDTYQPISCASYDTYEIAIMRKTPLSLSWRDEQGQIREEQVLPVDLRTERGSGEFLLAQGKDGERYRIRLDRILKQPNT